MESRLPHPLKEAMLDNEVQSGIKLLAMALSGLVGAGGVALTAFLLVGSKAAIAVGGGILIITALTIFRALWKLDQPVKFKESIDRELLHALVAMDRRALMITDFNGVCLTANYGFERLSKPQVSSIKELAIQEKEQAILSKLLRDVTQFGAAKGDLLAAIEEPASDDTSIQLETNDADKVRLALNGRRIGKYILWQVNREDDASRLDREKSVFGQWMAPIFEKLDCGVVLEDKNGRPHFVNETLCNWLELRADQELPHKLMLREDESQLLLNDRRRIDVDIIDVALATRENDRTIGRYRIIRRLDQMHGRLMPREREFLIDPIIDAAPIAVAVVDSDGVMREFNKPLKRHPAGKNIAPGDTILDLVKTEDRADLKKFIRYAFDGRPAAAPLDIVFNTQPERVGQVFASSVSDGKDQCAILYLVDTTQEKSLERQFVQAQKMQAVGQLAGGIAHDFNNLLTAIIGFCDLLLVRHDAGDQSFSDIIQIKQNANRAANLVRQLLAFSRQQTLRPKILMLTDVLAELANLVRRLIGENIDLKMIHGRDLYPVKVDQGQLEQVLINLAVNARDAMISGGRLEIKTSMIAADHPLVERYDVIVPDDYVLVEVSDTGCGIPKDNLNKIFEPFFTTKEVGQGTGLGLATVYGIVKQTGGFVFVESEVGKGTTFLLFLKAHGHAPGESKDNKPVIEEAARDLTGKGTILVVEDEDPVRLFACRALTNKGYHVLEASSGEAGLEILLNGKEKVDLLISDVIMPSMDGPTLVKEARKELPDLPVIFVSGYAEDVFRKNLETEEFQFLPKPFTLNDLAEHVKSILG